LTLALLIAAVACALRLAGRRRAAGWVFVAAAMLSYLSALVPVGDALLSPLEHRYPALRDGEPLPSLGGVVVLGSGYSPREAIPVTGALDEDGLARIVEGVRLVRQLPGVRLVVSGGALRDAVPSAQGYAKLARELGIPETSIVVLDQSLDTGDESRTLAKLFGRTTPFILVTSAYHMPRAVLLMQRAGARPIPAPTGQRVGSTVVNAWTALLPSANGLRMTEQALHEYAGLAALAVGLD
jgi:uncharacterized SAM-binding protein YcdF (DUF218 family)